MNHPTVRESVESGTPFIDPEERFKMKFSTLRAIVCIVAAGCIGGTGWAVNMKMSLNKQEERSARIEVQVNALTDSLHEQTKALTKQTDALSEQRFNLKLMDVKLDNITRQTK